MNFSEQHKLTLLKSEDNILAINFFSNNDDNHYYSISADANVKEWVLEKNNLNSKI